MIPMQPFSRSYSSLQHFTPPHGWRILLPGDSDQRSASNRLNDGSFVKASHAFSISARSASNFSRFGYAPQRTWLTKPFQAWLVNNWLRSDCVISSKISNWKTFYKNMKKYKCKHPSAIWASTVPIIALARPADPPMAFALLPKRFIHIWVLSLHTM